MSEVPPLKLRDMRGNVLGALVVPRPLFDKLVARAAGRYRDSVSWSWAPPIAGTYDWGKGDLSVLMAPSVNIHTASLTWHSMHGDSIVLYGMTLEQVEQQDGFLFFPGADYVRILAASAAKEAT
jgi:hypothetical protein